MNHVQDFGERLWAGQVGNGFVVLSFVAALISCLFFYLSDKDTSFLKLARIAFRVHSFSVLAIAGTLFFMLFNHYFEYQYVYQHSNTEMHMKYIMSCFWEGPSGMWCWVSSLAGSSGVANGKCR